MRGVFRSATGVIACCDEDGCSVDATVVVGPRHLCVEHAWEEEHVWKAVAHLGLRPMSREEIAERKGVR